MKQDYQCNLCASQKFSYRPKFTDRLGCDRQKHSVVKCKRCGLHSLFPLPTNYELDNIYEDYAAKGDRIAVEEYRMEYVYPQKVRLFKKYLSNSNNILDIGAGLGGFTAIAKRSGLNVTGIEPVQDQCDLAKKLFDIDLVCKKLEEFYGENCIKYDAIHLHHVLEHFLDPKSALLEIKKVLRPNGVLILEVPNEFFVLKTELYARLGKINFERSYNPYHHIHFFSPWTLEKLMLKSEFKILEMNDIFQGSFKSTFKNRMSRSLAKMLRMGTSSRIEVVAISEDGF